MSTGKKKLNPKKEKNKAIIVPPNQKDMDDCVARSLSIASHVNYIDVKKELKDIADELDEEEYRAWTIAKIYMKRNGFEQVDTSQFKTPIKKVKDFVALNLEGGYVLSTPGHLTCVYSGWITDTWDTSSERVFKIFKYVGE